MGRLVMVRHAQASFLSQNYDQLSPLGETQARLLGEYWAQRKVAFDRVCTGTAVRHRHTAEIVKEACRTKQLAFPEPMMMADFDEFQGEKVLAESLPQLLESDPAIRELHDAMQMSSNQAEKHTDFQRLFGRVISLWANGNIAAPTAEPWRDFCARVDRGLESFLVNSGKGEAVAIFTSGGPLGVAVRRALHLSTDDTLQVAWMLRNCSFTEFLYSGDRFTLSSFNAFPHLDDDSLLTYR
jgi:broad specificity phosphatase PhoE